MPELETTDEQRQRDFWTGYYEATKRLSTSPRMNRPQMAVIKDQAAMCQEKLEALDVKFTEKVSG